ncbi:MULTISPECIES: ABC transporter ATP-binding protein [unclassified Shewanella]|uniref:ABC transporter ATP-binding protein n=1 Tax=unclassified Shewanella TaxID=196818 RepID=UPI000C82F8B5|nr:ABC transporter ATP-binding protein [Shewanella sp. 10N.286.51.B7]PMG77002.1 ABC transporter [Shewanella sp. 10N.286.51.B7]
MPRNSVIQVQNLIKQYGEFTAVDKISLQVHAGETLALLGHNGAGKSSLIKMLLGIVKPTSGQITMMGKTVTHEKDRRQINLGYLPENISLYEKLTGKEVLNYFAALKRIDKSKVLQVLEEFGLEHAQDNPVKSYSKGMKQRLGFAQAILSSPDILLLDEPTVGLDPQASLFMYQKIDELKRQGCAIVVCTHELAVVEDNIDRAFIMANGMELASGCVETLRQLTDLKVLFKGEEINQAIAEDEFLNTLAVNNQLLIHQVDKPRVMQYLTQHCGVYNFSIEEPGLSDIYHHCMNNRQQNVA